MDHFSGGHFIVGDFKFCIDYCIFSLITWILGGDTISLPYLSAVNGIVIASVLIVFGAAVSYFWGMLLVKWAEIVGSDKYEDFARYWYGNKPMKIVGVWIIITMDSYAVSYIVFIKTLIPQFLVLILGSDNAPEYLGKGQWKGEIFWASIYTFLILIPFSMPRKINTLRFTSIFGVIWTFYLIMCLVFMFFFDKSLVPNISDNFKNAFYFKITFEGLVRSVPFVYFAFLYQPWIPIIYRELNQRNYRRMGKVLIRGSGIAVFLYILASWFGYLGLVSHQDYIELLLLKSNILEIDYGNWAFNIAVVCIMVAIFAVTPFCILPAKDTFEELFWANSKMSK